MYTSNPAHPAAIKISLRKLASFVLVFSLVVQLIGMTTFERASANSISNNLEEESLDGSGVFAKKSGFRMGAEADGSFRYSYDLTLPPGRNGLTPSISLNYNSNNSSDHTIIGQGWDISIPRIERYGRTGVDNLYGSSTGYISTFSGELVQGDVSTDYNARIETGDFYSHTYENNKWIAYDKSGTRYSFGSTTNSRQENNSGTKVYAWYLDEVRDTNGNFISYNYRLHGGVLYPKEIIYGGNEPVESIFTVEFSTSSATSQVTSYETGFPVVRDYLIDKVNIYVNDKITRNYSFTYGNLDQSGRDVLTEISEEGYSSSGTTTVPHVEFTYSAGGSNSWSIDANYEDTFPEGVTQTDGTYKDNGTRLIDINGDGLVDMVRFYQVTDYDETQFYTVKKVHINEGGGNWDVDADWDWDGVSLAFVVNEDGWSTGSHAYHDLGSRFSDVNGDGLVDIVTGFYCHPTSCDDDQFEIDALVPQRNRVYINTGSGWSYDSSWENVPTFTYWNISDKKLYSYGVELIDINGDGLPDIVDADYKDNSTSTPSANVESEIWMNTGSGWVHDTSRDNTFPAPLIRGQASQQASGYGGSPTASQFVDVNGDGLIDVVRSYDHEIGESDPGLDDESVYLNTGNGWERDSTYSNSLPTNSGYAMYLFQVSGSDDKGYRFIDVNADGLPDIVRADGDSSDVVYWNTGYDFSNATSYAVPQDFIDDAYDPGDRGVRSIDMDGDTLPDLVFAPKTGTTTGTGDLYVNQRNHPILLTEVATKEGGAITIGYDGYQATQLGSIEKMGRIPFTHIVVTSVEKDAGYGNRWNQNFEYENAYYYYNEDDLTTRRFAGFGTVIETNDLGETTTYYHQGNGNNSSSSELVDDYALMGLPYRSEAADLSGNVYSVTRTNWATSSLSASSTFVKRESVVELKYDGDNDHKDTAIAYTYDSNNGAVLTETEYGEVSGNLDGTFTDTGTDKRTITYTYATNTDHVVVPATEVVTNNASTKVRESKYYYDNQSLGTVTDGNLTKREDWISGSSYAETKWSYNSYGLPITMTDPRDKVTSYAYDSFNLYVASTTDAENLVSKYEYDYSSGKVATTTDPNDQVFVTLYDGLDRVTHEYIPDPVTGSQVLKTEIVYTDTSGSVSIKQTNYLNSTVEQDVYTYYDGFGKTIQERIESETSSFIAKDYVYGADGLLTAESLPYFSAGSSRTASTSDQDLYTEYIYDALQRVTSASTTVGATLTSYDQWEEEVTDPLGNTKSFEYDAFGRLAQVAEENSTSTYTTSYTYDANDNLTKITDALGNEREIAYDGLSRRTSLDDLHDTADTSYGTWTFTYDAAGNLTQQVDPKSQTVNFTYDDINRVLTEDYTGQTGTEVTYTYDTCTLGKGKVCQVVNPDVTTTYTYDYVGNVASEAKLIDSTTHTTEYEFDRLGNETLITYPDDSEVRYTYNDGNQIEKIEQKENGGSFTDVIADFDYGPHGMITYQLHGNNSETTRTYDADELYRLQSIVTTASSSYGTGGSGEELLLLEQELFGEPEAQEPLVAETVIETVPAEPEVQAEEEAAVVEEAPEDEPAAEPVVEKTIAAAEIDVVEAASTTVEDIVVETDTGTTSGEAVIEDTSAPKEAASTTTDAATSTDKIATSSSAVDPEPPVAFGIASSTAQLVPDPPIETAVTTEETVIPSAVITLRDHMHTDKLITDRHEARVWQKYHRERVEALQAEQNLDPAILERATAAQDHFEDYLLQKGYTDDKRSSVKSGVRDEVAGRLKNIVKELISFALPPRVYAYLFDVEDFESCGSLPCSLDTDSSWGSVTASLDSGGQIEGDDSLKMVVSGAGAGSQQSVNYDEDEIWVQFKLYVPDPVTWGASSYFSILRLEDSSDGSIFWMSVEDWGSPRLTVNGDVLSYTNTSLNLTEGAVNTIEVRFKKGTSDGAVDIWLNNDTEGSPDYSSGNVNTGTDNVDDILFGVTYAPESGVSTTYFDDLLVDSAFIGDHAASGGGAATEPFIEKVQDLAYTYDAVGNITEIVDNSDTTTAATTTYGYDDLYRLTSASTTMASTTGYARTFAYNAIGNITNKSDTGTYAYNGHQAAGSSYQLYGDDVASGWADQSWASSVDPDDTSPVHEGSESIEVVYASAWQGLKYKTGDFDTSDYDGLELAVNVGTDTSVNLHLYFRDTNDTLLDVVNLDSYNGGGWSANTWEEVSIPLTDLDMDNRSGTTSFHIEADAAATVHYDDITFTSSSGGANYANPHAATAINGVTYTYDANGNLTSTGAGLTNTWNYQNRLTQSSLGGTTVDYQYDHTGARVQKDDGTTETVYVNRLYEEKGTTTTKHIYAGNMLVASVEEDTPAPVIYHNHLDHLHSTNVVTGADGHLNQINAYYPFGDDRIDTNYGSVEVQKQFTGHTKDDETDLSYMGARYYDGGVGRFKGQDPVSLALGNIGEQSLMTERSFESYLRDPQGHNTYSYARNNPILFVDENGEWFKEFATGQQSFTDFQIEVGQATKYMTDNSATWDWAVSNPKKAGAVVGLAGAGAAAAGVQGVAAYKSSVVTVSGVGKVLVPNRLIEGSLYGYLSYNGLSELPSWVDQASQISADNPQSVANFGGRVAWEFGPSQINETIEAVTDTIKLITSVINEREQKDESDDSN